MSHIYIYSPCGAVRDRMAFRRAITRLKALGHDVEIDPDALSRHQRFAGPDTARLQAIERAAASAADLALISRGGYGLTRLLPHLPYAALARAIENGTQFVGMSDFTALQCALYAQTGAITWAGPSLCADFGAPTPPDDIMQACLDDLLCQQGEGTGWRIPPSDLRAATHQPELDIPQGTLWGGNLSVLCALLGTPWLPPIEQGILFVEDVNEHPYRIERQLSQLLHAGILNQQKAILLGAFTGYQLTPHDRGFKMQTVIDWLRTQTPTPILTGLPFGHVATKVLLPVGAPVQLVLQGRDALLYWG